MISCRNICSRIAHTTWNKPFPLIAKLSLNYTCVTVSFTVRRLIMQQYAHGGVAAPSATSLFPINYQPNAFTMGTAVGVMGALVREQLPCIPPGTLWPPFINVPKVEAWQAAHTTFDLDAGRNVEYEPEMTSQARSVERMNHEDLYVSVLGPHVCRDPSDYARAAETAMNHFHQYLSFGHKKTQHGFSIAGKILTVVHRNSHDALYCN